MAVGARHARYSLDDYLRLEEYANVKHEYLDGVIHAMAGGTPEHGAITMRIGAALVAQPKLYELGRLSSARAAELAGGSVADQI